MAETTIFGWDLGGAHLKRVGLDASGRITEARQVECPLWRGVEYLTAALESVHDAAQARDAIHAITMTGELCDNFESREDGVARIAAAAVDVLGAKSTTFYAGASGWLAPEALDPGNRSACASANWYAMAQAVAGQVSDALLIDVGSTTTDLVPVSGGAVACRGIDDASRLQARELVYTGVVRTPLMAVADTAPFDGDVQGVAAEYFANMGDVYRLRGELPEDADLHDTADDADRSDAANARRVLRMLGRDPENSTRGARRLADYFAYRQFDALQRAYLRVCSGMERDCDKIIAAGVGHFLVERLAAFNGIECTGFPALFELAGADPHMVSTCAPAAAVATLRRAAL